MFTIDFFDEWAYAIRYEDPDESYGRILHHLNEQRRLLPLAQWKQYAGAFQKHRVHKLLCQCPLYRRAFQKPRGYPGDAVLFDFIYGLEPLPADTSPLGEQFYRWQLMQSVCRSIRARRDLVAETIDGLADRVRRPAILSVGCGHLREAHKSRAVTEGRIDRFRALDQDWQTLSVVESELPRIEIANTSVRDLLAGKANFKGTDLVYSLGLYDYLEDATATKLTRILFEMVRPGGSILVANFAPNLPDIGLMEAGMDWWLRYRDEVACERFTWGISDRHPRRLFRDRDYNSVFIEINKLS
jgi:extracellular factor (EF) 3-hydroxypalmitic acid methyl ester biosynthesis protein